MKVKDLIGKQFILAIQMNNTNPVIYRISGDPTLEEGIVDWENSTGDHQKVKWSDMFTNIQEEKWFCVANDEQLRWMRNVQENQFHYRNKLQFVGSGDVFKYCFDAINKIIARPVSYYGVTERGWLNVLLQKDKEYNWNR